MPSKTLETMNAEMAKLNARIQKASSSDDISTYRLLLADAARLLDDAVGAWKQESDDSSDESCPECGCMPDFHLDEAEAEGGIFGRNE